MTLHVYSARISYRGQDRFDITRKSGGEGGHPFAPSWEILRPALEARKRAAAMREEGERHAADALSVGRPDLVPIVRKNSAASASAIETAAWGRYELAFFEEIIASQHQHRRAWEELLARERVVLVCYCTDPKRCHRALLRAHVLPRLGAIDCGELPEAAR